MTLDAADVLARAAEWIWVPEDARELPTPEYRVVAFPDHYAEPTEAMPRPGHASTRPADAVVDDVLGAVEALGRTSVTVMGLRAGSTPAGLEQYVVDRGGVLVETLAVLARPLTGELSDLQVPADVVLRPVEDLQTVTDADRVSVEVFGGSRRTPEQLEVAVTRLVSDDPGWVAYREGSPVGAAGLALVDGIARFWGASVLPAAQHTGVYRALLDQRLRHARDAGCRMALVKGRVETSAPVLRRAGFTAYGEERAYRLTVG